MMHPGRGIMQAASPAALTGGTSGLRLELEEANLDVYPFVGLGNLSNFGSDRLGSKSRVVVDHELVDANRLARLGQLDVTASHVFRTVILIQPLANVPYDSFLGLGRHLGGEKARLLRNGRESV